MGSHATEEGMMQQGKSIIWALQSNSAFDLCFLPRANTCMVVDVRVMSDSYGTEL